MFSSLMVTPNAIDRIKERPNRAVRADEPWDVRTSGIEPFLAKGDVGDFITKVEWERWAVDIPSPYPYDITTRYVLSPSHLEQQEKKEREKRSRQWPAEYAISIYDVHMHPAERLLQSCSHGRMHTHARTRAHNMLFLNACAICAFHAPTATDTAGSSRMALIAPPKSLDSFGSKWWAARVFEMMTVTVTVWMSRMRLAAPAAANIATASERAAKLWARKARHHHARRAHLTVDFELEHALNRQYSAAF